MPGPLLHVAAAVQCPHAGQVSVVTSNTRVLVGGRPVATLPDTYPIVGCVFTVPGPKPQPCLTVRWLLPSTRLLVCGSPALLQTSAGLCHSAEQVPQGPATVAAVQTRVVGT